LWFKFPRDCESVRSVRRITRSLLDIAERVPQRASPTGPSVLDRARFAALGAGIRFVCCRQAEELAGTIAVAEVDPISGTYFTALRTLRSVHDKLGG
jgi:hypothetical protein